MQAAYDVFGDSAFRKRYRRQANRYPISKPLFEAWGVGLARRSDAEVETLRDNRRDIADQFILLMEEDREFETAISYATGVPARVKKRFSTIEQLIGRCL